MNLGGQRNLINVFNPGAPVSDGDGGFTLTYSAAMQPTWWASIERAGQQKAARVFSDTTLSHATHLLQGRFHPQLITKSRVTWTDRSSVLHTADVLDVDDVQGRGVETVALVSEIAA